MATIRQRKQRAAQRRFHEEQSRKRRQEDDARLRAFIDEVAANRNLSQRPFFGYTYQNPLLGYCPTCGAPWRNF
jgi:hypothetical protein